MLYEVDTTPLERAIIQFTNALYDPDNLKIIRIEEIRDALSSGQYLSKKWLIEQFLTVYNSLSVNEEYKVAVVGGWVGILASALNHSDSKIIADSIDIDPNATKIADSTLRQFRGKGIVEDMYKLSYENYDCIVNTSGEHIEDVKAWCDLIPTGKLVVVQSNNARHIEGHIACVDSAEELQAKLNLSEVNFAGELKFPMYTRFMIIGKK